MALGRIPGEGGDDGEEGLFAEINITPLTDIFLVLLIIFMVTSSVMSSAGARAGLNVNLPKAASQELAVASADLFIAVAPDGKMSLGGEVVETQALLEALARALEKDPGLQVIVQADANTPHGVVVAVMELARTVGVTRLAVATRASK